MDMGLKGKAAIITGGSRGLGRSMALALAAEGCQVAICARGKETLQATVQELRGLGAEAIGVRADIASAEDPERVYKETKEAFGKVDIIVANAGGRRGTDILATTDAEWSELFQFNLMGNIRLMRLAIPEMQQRHWGRIITISSIWGREYGSNVTYMTAKAALIGMTKNLSVQLAPYNILVNCVAPGSVAFPGGGWGRLVEQQPGQAKEFIKQNLPLGRFGRPEEIGSVVAFLASEKASLLTGACINVDGGQSKSLI